MSSVARVTEISAILLQQIARYSSAHLGGPLDGVCISVPAYYPLSQREAVRNATEAVVELGERLVIRLRDEREHRLVSEVREIPVHPSSVRT